MFGSEIKSIKTEQEAIDTIEKCVSLTPLIIQAQYRESQWQRKSNEQRVATKCQSDKKTMGWMVFC
jgi:hypothetical protein